MICQYVRIAAEIFPLHAWALLAGRVLANAYTLLLMLGLIALFAAAQKVIELIGEQYFGQQLGSLAGVLGAAIAATAIVPLHHRTSHWAEQRFRSGLAALREGLPLLVGDLREVAGSRVLADEVLGRVEGGVRASHGAIVLDHAVLACRNADPGVARDWQARTP